MEVDADLGTVLRIGDSVPSPAASSTATALVRALATVPGTTYAAVVDERSGVLLAEAGSAGSGAALTALLEGARRVARGPGPGALDDLVVTTDRAFHVLRCRPTAEGAVWAYLRVDRRRGNLALARRAAGTAGAAPAPGRPAAPRDPGPRLALPKRPPAALPGARRTAGPRPWPRRAPTAASAPPTGLPAPVAGWSADADTLRRLLTGLHRLA